MSKWNYVAFDQHADLTYKFIELREHQKPEMI